MDTHIHFYQFAENLVNQRLIFNLQNWKIQQALKTKTSESVALIAFTHRETTDCLKRGVQLALLSPVLPAGSS